VSAFAISGFLEKPTDRKVLPETLNRAGVTLAGKATVLLVGDNEADLALYQIALKECGLIVSAHSSAGNALCAASEELPDIVVLDLIMPEIVGFEFMWRFREIDGGKAVPVTVLIAKDLVRKEFEALHATAARSCIRDQAPSMAPGRGQSRPLCAQFGRQNRSSPEGRSPCADQPRSQGDSFGGRGRGGRSAIPYQHPDSIRLCGKHRSSRKRGA
jgi:CheY-like chemotaxis protein